jgi:hypothetical protein
MNKLTRYRSAVKRHLTDLAALVSRASNFGLEAQCIFDEANDQYLLLYVGWDDRKRYHNTALHVRIRDGHIWIQEDNTEEGIAPALVKAGIPSQDIVLAFHPPELRHLTEYAVA